MFYGLLADVIVAIHVGYVGYVVVGELVILLGLVRRWAWVRNPWFRWTHVLAITIVGVEALFTVECPLTQWERDLRVLAGQTASDVSFVGRLANDLLFYDVPEWIFTALHIGFAVLVIATLVLAPPRRFRARPGC